MKKIWIAIAAAGLPAISLAISVSAVMPAWAQTPARNVWDGVFTADQATQGKTAYDNKCSTCHGAELLGQEMAPALSGGLFLGNWSGQSVSDLFSRIKTTMPANDPGSLGSAETATITTYILSFNKFPAGATALPSDDAGLSIITITAEKPAGK